MALRAHCTKSIAIIATVFFGFSSAATGAVAFNSPGESRSLDVQTLDAPFQSDNPHEPVDDHQIWRDQLIELLKLIRARLAAQSTSATIAMTAGSGATTEDVVEESEQLQYEYAVYGIKQDLTPAELDELSIDLVGALELLSDDPGVLTLDQRDALAQTLNAMLAEISN